MASVRSRKKQIASHLFMCMLGRQLETWLNTPDAEEKKMMEDGHAARCKLLDATETHTWPPQMPVHGRVNTSRVFSTDDFMIEYVVVKVNGGEVVDTFDTREAALELVLKHHRHKKAKLQVMNSLTGELVLFTEKEMMA